MKYLIWSYDYSHASAGPKALHRLCHELNEAGQEAYVGSWITNPAWNTLSREAPLDGDWCAVYPEIVSGNPWNAPLVVRWVLNTPGKLGGDTVYDPAEIVFSWSRQFHDAPLLWLPAFDLDIYTDRGEERSGEAFYVGKGHGDMPGTEITYEMRLDRYALADALNRATVLYSFDDTTAMACIALLCGCPVVMPNGERLEPAGYRERYLAEFAAFPDQLATFVRMTQSALVPA
jgi:hypothetical protein